MPADRLHRLRIVVKAGTDGTKVLDRLTHPLLRGKEFSDTLSPVLSAIGLDITEQLSFARPHNLLVEGISDHFYVNAFARILRPTFLEKVNVFPGSGATTLPILASLFIGWGLRFGILLDRDEEGKKANAKLARDYAILPDRVVHPQDAITIEDVFSPDDFRQLLAAADDDFTLDTGERPSESIKRQGIDKVLLARIFAERVGAGNTQLTQKTRNAAEKLLGAMLVACGAPVD